MLFLINVKQKKSKRISSGKNKEEKEILKKLGLIISDLAVEKKLSLVQLAYESDVSKGFIYDLANGNANPSILVLYRLAKANDMTLV